MKKSKLMRRTLRRFPNVFVAFFTVLSVYILLLVFKAQFKKLREVYDVDKIPSEKSFANSISRFKKICKTYPNLPTEVNTENELWQVLSTSDGTFKMFNAYYDNRKHLNGESLIRILALIDRVDPKVQTHCQIWYDKEKNPVIVPTLEYKLVWRKQWGNNTKGSSPYLLSCAYPLKNVPISVSLVEGKCDQPGNNLQISYNPLKQSYKKPFGICVKDLDFMDDQSMQIIEWIEILSILGAEKFFIYVIKVHPNVMRVLQYYQTMGKVEIEKMTEPIGLPNRTQSLTQWLQNELISLNDCLYKHMYEFDFLSPLDIDEIIVPTRPGLVSWEDVIIRTANSQGQQQAYVAQNVFFLSDNNHEGEVQTQIPEHFFFLQHVYRAARFSKPGIGSKAFHSTEEVILMHNHFPLACFNNDNCKYGTFAQDDGQLSHYRTNCENYPKDECLSFKKDTMRDESLWYYKDDVIRNVNEVLQNLKSLNVKWD